MRAVVRGICLGVLVVATSGCRDSTGTDREEPAAFRFSVELAGGVRRYGGYFSPGRIPTGERRSVEAPMRVDGQDLQLPGYDRRQVGVLLQGALDSLFVAGMRPLEVTPPVIRGVVPNLPRATLTTIQSLQGDSTTLEADGAVVLRVRIAEGGATWTERFWQLVISGAEGSVGYSGRGLPPEELVVPRSLLPSPQGGGWVATLNATEVHSRELELRDQRSYVVEIQVRNSVFVRVRPRPASASR